MTELLLDVPIELSPAQPSPQSILTNARHDSHERWLHLIRLATDFAFETDAEGRFVFVMPETVLGWPAGALIGQPSDLFTGDDGSGPVSNPFRPTVEVRRERAWVRCFNSRLALVTVSASPLFDAAGQIVGGRGVIFDMMHSDAQTSQIAGRLRRGETLDHILMRVGREINADSMLDAALWPLIMAVGAEGAAVIGAGPETASVELMHECGPGAAAVVEAAGRLLKAANPEPAQAINLDGRVVLTAGCFTRYGTNAGLVIWRKAHSRQWDQEDMALAGSAVTIVRLILEYETVQQEMAYHVRADTLTGLLNRRALLEEITRQGARLDREDASGTLLLVEIDALNSITSLLGGATGDNLLVAFAGMLRNLVRPFDLVARLGGNEFAVWLNGADHMTAAERADELCKTAPLELRPLLDRPFPQLGLSIGLATRRPGSQEAIEALIKRAGNAMRDVKRDGCGHWRMAADPV